MTDFQLKFFLLMGLLAVISSIGILAIYFHDKRNQPKISDQEFTPDESHCDKREVVEGCIVEYSYFFLKADSDGFVITPDGGLSIEYFRDKNVELDEGAEALQAKSSERYIKTNLGPIHKQHFIPKGA